MGTKDWGDRILELLWKGCSSDQAGSKGNPSGAKGQAARDPADALRDAFDQQLRQMQQQAQQQLNAIFLQRLHTSTVVMPPGIAGTGHQGGLSATAAALRQQYEIDRLAAERDRREREERNAERYIVIECKITSTDEVITL